MASLTDKITDVRNSARPNSARVSSGRSAGATTLACDNLAGWPTASKVHFVTYQIDSNSNPVAGTQLDCYGIVSGNNIGSFTVVDGTDTGNSVNDVVEMLPTAAWGQDLSDALLVGHTRTGAHIASLPLTTPILTNPTISTITNSGTLTLPTSTDTLVGRVTTDTLTHKTITDTTNSVSSAILTNPYKFSVYRNAAANTGNGAFAIVVFDTKTYDTGVNFSTGTGLFTAPIAGFYQFNCNVTITSTADTAVAIYKNGVIYASVGQGTASSGQLSLGGASLISLAANDTIGIQAYASSTKALVVGTVDKCQFSGFLVSQT